MRYLRPLALVLVLAAILLAGSVIRFGEEGDRPEERSPEGQRIVIDSRGVEVEVPAKIDRVVTISDGLILEVMTVLGVEEKLVGVGSRTFQEVDTYVFPTVEGEEFAYRDGMNTMAYLNPWTKDLPVIAEYDGGVNYEALASLRPDVVIVRLGSCTFWTNDEITQKAVDRIESLGFPTVVLYGTNFYDRPDISTLWDEVRIVGSVFGKEDEAEELVDYLQSSIDQVTERTRNVTEDEKPDVLYFGLANVARDEGGAGNTVSLNSYESWTLENVVNAKNAFREDSGYWHVISAEHVLAINPQVIVLPTDWGYHPARELYEAPYYQSLQEVEAVRNRRVVSLPYTPYDCAKRLEYPIEVMVMAWAAYPDRFEDIDLGEWVLEFYEDVYGVDRETAEGLRSAQWLDWTAEEA